MKTPPLFQDFIKDKLPDRNYHNSDWREHSVEYVFAHILFKAGVTKLEFGEYGLHKRVSFRDLTVDKYIPVIYNGVCLPLFWALLRSCRLDYSGGAGNERKSYAQACLSSKKIKSPHPQFSLGQACRIATNCSDEFMKNIYCYFHQLMYDEKTKN